MDTNERRALEVIAADAGLAAADRQAAIDLIAAADLGEAAADQIAADQLAAEGQGEQ